MKEKREDFREIDMDKTKEKERFNILINNI